MFKLILLIELTTLFGQSFLHASTAAYQNNAVITGTLTALSECTKTSDNRNPQVWLSMGQTLLYQVEVPINGTYEFHVVPGKYDLMSNNSAGCLTEKHIEVSAKQVAQIHLNLTPVKSK